jgi:hypothetical protein
VCGVAVETMTIEPANRGSRQEHAAPFALTLLRSRRPVVGFGYFATPRQEVGRGVVAIDDAFDQRRPVTVGECDFDGFLLL